MPPTADDLKRLFPADEAHYQFLKTLDPREQWAVKYLYDRLNIVDSKTGAMLRVNSVIIGFLGTIAVLLARTDVKISWAGKAAVLCWITANLAILTISDLISLGAIFWLRFDRITDANDFGRYRQRFYEVTIKREGLLRIVIGLSFAGEIMFVLLFLFLAYIEIA
jgi:hypothetical protein